MGFVFSIAKVHDAQDDPVPQWIWPSESAAPNEAGFFRTLIDIPADAKRVILIAAGDNKLDVNLNGQRGGRLRSDSWENPLVADITDRVKRGQPNLFAAQVRNDGGPAGFLAVVRVEKGDGSIIEIVSDASWESSTRAEKGWFSPEFKAKATKWAPAKKLADLGGGPWTKVNASYIAGLRNLRKPEATPVDRIKLPEGFHAELLYSVPKSDQGSWVAMTVDDKGRLIVSDQYGALYRIKTPLPGEIVSSGDVEKIEVDIGGAHGLLWAFESLYAVLNVAQHGGRGLYRITDSDGDDKLDKKELLAKFEEVGGEHGPHAVLLSPDQKSLTIVCGNQTPAHLVKDGKPFQFQKSRVPRVWDEDILLERPIGRGFMKGTPAPGGWIARTDPDGKEWELLAVGFRNQYDAAYDRNGELFTFDADMEWDMNLPWYRPTRINHVVSGAEFGWRNGGGKWPAYYPDSVGAVVDIGPGSPTGVAFGYRSKFPQKYQNALYAADWSYGKLYAVHIEHAGGSYTASFEEFMSAQPLPLTDLVINPKDGAMYVAIGGRRVQSGLYRVTYAGDEAVGDDSGGGINKVQGLRREFESLHSSQPDPTVAVEKAFNMLAFGDRSVRYAARIALEHQPVEDWQERALAAENDVAAIQALIALARHAAKGDGSLQSKILARLNGVDWGKLRNHRERIDLVRAYGLAFTRLGEPSESGRDAVSQRLDPVFPAGHPDLNIELLQVLCYLQSPSAAKKGIDLLETAPLQEEQIALAKSLRHLKEGWTLDLRTRLFEWFARATGYKGGPSFQLFIEDMKKTALGNTPEAEKVALKSVIEKKVEQQSSFVFEPRELVKMWKVEDFDALINVGLEGGRDFANGRKMFGVGTCFACHRFNQEGGAVGPDLTSVSGKFSPRDLLESIIEPSKEISDQYGSMIFTMNDGSMITGRIMNLSGDTIRVNTNMMDPNAQTGIDRKQLKKMEPSPLSMMPPGLINTMSEDDVLDLLAYLLSRGNAEDPLFQ